jgi:hypothetical protein
LRSGRGNTLSCSAIAGVCGEQGEREENIILKSLPEKLEERGLCKKEIGAGKKRRIDPRSKQERKPNKNEGGRGRERTRQG